MKLTSRFSFQVIIYKLVTILLVGIFLGGAFNSFVLAGCSDPNCRSTGGSGRCLSVQRPLYCSPITDATGEVVGYQGIAPADIVACGGWCPDDFPYCHWFETWTAECETCWCSPSVPTATPTPNAWVQGRVYSNASDGTLWFWRSGSCSGCTNCHLASSLAVTCTGGWGAFGCNASGAYYSTGLRYYGGDTVTCTVSGLPSGYRCVDPASCTRTGVLLPANNDWQFRIGCYPQCDYQEASPAVVQSYCDANFPPCRSPDVWQVPINCHGCNNDADPECEWCAYGSSPCTTQNCECACVTPTPTPTPTPFINIYSRNSTGGAATVSGLVPVYWTSLGGFYDNWCTNCSSFTKDLLLDDFAAAGVSVLSCGAGVALGGQTLLGVTPAPVRTGNWSFAGLNWRVYGYACWYTGSRDVTFVVATPTPCVRAYSVDQSGVPVSVPGLGRVSWDEPPGDLNLLNCYNCSSYTASILQNTHDYSGGAIALGDDFVLLGATPPFSPGPSTDPFSPGDGLGWQGTGWASWYTGCRDVTFVVAAPTCAPTPPEQPVLDYPINGAVLSDLGVNFQWGDITNWGDNCGVGSPDYHFYFQEYMGAPPPSCPGALTADPGWCAESCSGGDCSCAHTFDPADDGKTFCWQVEADNDGTNDDVGETPSSVTYFTFNLGNPLAWFQTAAGDVHAQGQITSLIPTGAPQRYLSLVTFQEGGPGVVSSSTGGVDLGTEGGEVSNEGWEADDSFGNEYDFEYFNWKIGSAARTALASGPLPETSGIYYADSSVTLGEGTVTFGEKVIILVNGDLTLTSDVLVERGGFLGVFVAGDINLEASAREVHGIYVADGTINTCSSGDCVGFNNDLRGEGTLVGGSFVLPRSLGDNNNPAEVFSYRPDLIINSPVSLWTIPQVWQQLGP